MSTNLLKMTNFWIFYKKAFKFKFICDKMALVKLSKRGFIQNVKI